MFAIIAALPFTAVFALVAAFVVTAGEPEAILEPITDWRADRFMAVLWTCCLALLTFICFCGGYGLVLLAL